MKDIVVMSKRDGCPEGYQYVDVTSRNKDPILRTLSPFLVGPVECYDGLISKNMENAWQYSKVYKEYMDEDGNPAMVYFKWRDSGFKKTFAERYPNGRGATPAYSYWKNGSVNEHLGYVEARKKIYIPLYAKGIVHTPGYHKLLELKEAGEQLALVDFDGYRNESFDMSMKDVINCETKKMGHAFVLKMLLDGLLSVNGGELVDNIGLLKEDV